MDIKRSWKVPLTIWFDPGSSGNLKIIPILAGLMIALTSLFHANSNKTNNIQRHHQQYVPFCVGHSTNTPTPETSNYANFQPLKPANHSHNSSRLKPNRQHYPSLLHCLHVWWKNLGLDYWNLPPEWQTHLLMWDTALHPPHPEALLFCYSKAGPSLLQEDHTPILIISQFSSYSIQSTYLSLAPITSLPTSGTPSDTTSNRKTTCLQKPQSKISWHFPNVFCSDPI